MFRFCLLSAPLRSNGGRLCFATVYFYFFFIHRSFSETTRPILTKFSGIVYSGLVWIIRYFLNSSDAISWRKTLKTAKIWSKFHGLTHIFDNNFKTVKDNSNLKQTWTRGIVSLQFWQIWHRMVQGQLRSICPIGWQNLYFCQISTFSLLTQKLFNRFARNLQVNCAFWSILDNPGVKKLFWRHLAEINAKKQPKFAQNFTGWLRFLTITSKRSHGFSQFLHYLCI